MAGTGTVIPDLGDSGTRIPALDWHQDNDPCPWLAAGQGPGLRAAPQCRGVTHGCLKGTLSERWLQERAPARSKPRQQLPAAKAVPRAGTAVPPSSPLCKAQEMSVPTDESEDSPLTHYSQLQPVTEASACRHTKGYSTAHSSRKADSHFLTVPLREGVCSTPGR